MSSVVVSTFFWNSSIVQQMRLICPKGEKFRESDSITSDLLFPFYGSIAVSIFYPDHLNDIGVQKVQKMSESFPICIVIICISVEESEQYKHFLMKIPPKISAVVCFPPEQFSKHAAEFIWKTVENTKPMKRKFDQIIEEKRRLAMDPDYQSTKIFSSLIKDTHKRDEIIKIMTTRTGTIRKTFIEELPEVIEKDFFLQPKEDY